MAPHRPLFFATIKHFINTTLQDPSPQHAWVVVVTLQTLQHWLQECSATANQRLHILRSVNLPLYVLLTNPQEVILYAWEALPWHGSHMQQQQQPQQHVSARLAWALMWVMLYWQLSGRRALDKLICQDVMCLMIKMDHAAWILRLYLENSVVENIWSKLDQCT